MTRVICVSRVVCMRVPSTLILVHVMLVVLMLSMLVHFVLVVLLVICIGHGFLFASFGENGLGPDQPSFKSAFMVS